MGCQCYITFNGVTIPAIAADAGPHNKDGELSIRAAQLLGIPSSPINGGRSQHDILYEVYPGIPGQFNGITYPLQASRA
jgi:hypothetical protein